MVERILKLIQEKGLTANAVEKKLGFGNGAIRRFATNSPSIDKIIALSNLLNTSIDFIVFGHDAELHLSGKEELLLNGYRSMNEEGKEYIMQTLDMAKERYKKGTDSVFSAEDKAI